MVQVEELPNEFGLWLGNSIEMESRQVKSKEYLNGINKLTCALLLLALLPWPYSYYIFLRWFVFLSAIVHIGFSISWRRPLALLVFVSLGLLLNPIEPVYLSKGVWAIIDFFGAMFVVVGYEELTKV